MDMPPEESTDLEELEQFAKMFKQKRIKLGKSAFKLIGGTSIFHNTSLFSKMDLYKVT